MVLVVCRVMMGCSFVICAESGEGFLLGLFLCLCDSRRYGFVFYEENGSEDVCACRQYVDGFAFGKGGII